jgi:hypothetical protein
VNARTLQERDAGTPLWVPPPVLFNTWKHHAGALRSRVAAAAARGPFALAELGTHLAVLGTKLMDLYTGDLSPSELAALLLAQIAPDREGFAASLADGYSVVELPDGSRWVLRLGDDPQRWAHLHPGRWSPLTVRVRANVLKTALLATMHAAVHGGDARDPAVIDALRREHLGLPPVGSAIDADQGLGAMLDVLAGPTSPS